MIVTRNAWLRMLPVFAIAIITVIMSLVLYRGMVERETEECWDRLKVATESIAEKINVRLNDNLNFLESVSDSFVLTQHIKDETKVREYLTSVMEKTIFERIDIILPDGQILTQTGAVIKEGDLSYEELLKKGTHISPRMTSLFNNKEVIYCFTEIEYNGEVCGLLCGTIECETMAELFKVRTFSGEAQIFLIDCSDGSYIIDNWHEKLDNVYNLGDRELLDGDGKVDMASVIIDTDDERIAYVSNTNGENSYQYNVPLEDYNWELCVAVQENDVFANVHEMEKGLIIAGFIELILLIFYIYWNMWINLSAEKSEKKARKLELDKAKNEAKSKFISNMSHDIRTPINGIVGMLYIIKKHRDDKSVVDDCLKKIEISTQYLSTLTSDLLDINELENNKLILPQEPIDLRQLAKELCVVVDGRAKEANVEYSMDCSELINPCVIGSEVHLKRILVNLIGNAIKYSKDAGKKVWITIKQDVAIDDETSVYNFIIKDNGIGMSQEFQKNMYNAFEQEMVSARSSYQGYGLGLTIVNQLVNRMGGKIDLESIKGKGSTFIVSIPFKHADIRVLHNNDNEIVTDLSGMKILLVEDNAFNMEIAQVLLTDAGADVVTADNGKVAFEVFKTSEQDVFDLILMDLMMPDVDGYEATKMIRKMERKDAKTIPIIAMTASAFTEEIQRCKDVGMNEHIAKPLDINKLMSTISKYHKKFS